MNNDNLNTIDKPNNIIFSFEESDINNEINDESIKQIMDEFENEFENDIEDIDLLNLNLLNMNQQINNFSEVIEYNNKQDIISTIQYYESLPENIQVVQQRKTMWFYINELLNDSKMKKYVILF